MPHKIQHDATQADHDRGYMICKTCQARAIVFQAGYECTTWKQCERCDSWSVSAKEFDNKENTKCLII